MIKLTAQLIVILFCWIIYPYKWIKHYLFIRKKKIAIKKADERQKTSNSKIMVVQLGNYFKVGTKTELKSMDKLARKILKIKRSDKWIWDYRNSIIYSAK